MRILSYCTSHDAAVVLIEGGKLRFSLEGEKDDGARHAGINPTLFVRSLQIADLPDAIAISGSIRGISPADDVPGSRNRIGAGYYDETTTGTLRDDMTIAGKRVRRFSSSHVRSHIMCSYGLSPFPERQPCYALIWEGGLGAFYYLDANATIRKVGDVLFAPGIRYATLYRIANKALPGLDDAGKLMALAAYGSPGQSTTDENEVISKLLSLSIVDAFTEHGQLKLAFQDSRYFNIGVEAPEFKDLALRFSNALFDVFFRFAQRHCTQTLPLIIGGGCGLNCDWNSKWLQSGLFSDVFVPPCTNDSGIALGAAIDALHHYTGRAKIDWSVYAGESFVEDAVNDEDFVSMQLDLKDVCRRLASGSIIAWVQGRYEIGPRALGNRSLLAAPFSTATRDRLNQIKQREAFRPIAPVCLEEDFGCHFEHQGMSPFMLFFQRIRTKELAAVTHVDGSARAQTVNDSQNPILCALLREFRAQTGVSVLCNTSLNFRGYGFINRLSQLVQFARESGIDGMVVGSKFWVPRRSLDSIGLRLTGTREISGEGELLCE